MVRLAPQWCVWRRSGAFGAATVRLAPLRCVWRRNGAFGASPLDLEWTYKFLLSTLPILVTTQGCDGPTWLAGFPLNFQVDQVIMAGLVI